MQVLVDCLAGGNGIEWRGAPTQRCTDSFRRSSYVVPGRRECWGVLGSAEQSRHGFPEEPRTPGPTARRRERGRWKCRPASPSPHMSDGSGKGAAAAGTGGMGPCHSDEASARQGQKFHCQAPLPRCTAAVVKVFFPGTGTALLIREARLHCRDQHSFIQPQRQLIHHQPCTTTVSTPSPPGFTLVARFLLE